MPSGKNKVMFGVPSFISSQSQQLGQNLNLGQEYTPETAAKMQALERRQQLANILLQQGMQPKEARQAGRFVVAPSMWEQASGPLTTAMGALSSLYLDDQRSAIASDEAKRVAAAYQAYNEGTSKVPEFKGRTVPGTGDPGFAGTPALPPVSEPSWKPVAEALVEQEYPRTPKADTSWYTPEQTRPTPYDPAFTERDAVPGRAARPDRRESPYEALEREFGAQAAQDFVNNGFAPGTTPETAARMEQVVKAAERPDAPGRPRTPEELMAADTALLASGVPGAWPLVHSTMQQREALADREQRERIATSEAKAREKQAEASLENARATSAYHAALLAQGAATLEETKRRDRMTDERARIAQSNLEKERATPTTAELKAYDAHAESAQTSYAVRQQILDALRKDKDGLSINDRAFTGEIGQIESRLRNFMGSDDPAVMATQTLQSIFDKNALAKLKSSFGGQPSDREGEWLKRAEGMMSFSPLEREKFLKEGAYLLGEKLKRDQLALKAMRAKVYPVYDIESVDTSGLGSPEDAQRDWRRVPPPSPPSDIYQGPKSGPDTGWGFRPRNQE